MTGKTHMSIGLAASATVLSISNPTPQNVVMGLVLGTIGSLMPDIDIEQSKISYLGRKLLIDAILLFVVGSSVIYKLNIPLHEFKFNYRLSTTGIYGLAIIAGCIVFAKFTKHRSFAHSILGLVLFSIGFWLLLGHIALYFAIGFISHMTADTLTNSGIEVLYPIKQKVALKLIHTGSIIDYTLGGLAFVYFIFTMLKLF